MPLFAHNEFERFRFFVPPNNTAGSFASPISNDGANPTTLASLSIHSDQNDVVWLTATVGWTAVGGVTPLLVFQIWRDAPITGTLVARALDEAEANRAGIDQITTSFSHVDTNFSQSREYTYFLTAHVDSACDSVNATGPITFTAAEIELG